jgi:leucyl-tRNA---protein transferase
MLSNVTFPEYLNAELLDSYLENAWFRMGQSMFTTHFLGFDGQIYGAIWLRINLATFEFSKSQKNLMVRVSRFRIEVKKMELSDQHHALFETYRAAVNFDVSPSLKDLLMAGGSFLANIFDSYQVDVWDNHNLIGCGIFDRGHKGAQGIVSFYDRDYNRFSLGKFLILKKIEFLKDMGHSYFYPGYFAPNYPKFDYKLTLHPASTTYFSLKTLSWEGLKFGLMFPLENIRSQVTKLENALLQLGLNARKYVYDFFDLNMVKNFQGQKLFEAPYFFHLFTTIKGQMGLLCFDVLTENFQLHLCNRIYEIPEPRFREGHFNSYILKTAQILFSVKTVEEAIEETLAIFKISEGRK